MAHTFAHLIKAYGSFDRAAILRDAARMAKAEATGPLPPGFARQSYRACFAACLKLSWACAKAARAACALPAPELARRADRAALIFATQMIDHTPTSLRVRAAIEARI